MRSSIATLFIQANVKLGYNRKDTQDFQWLFTNRQVAYKPRIHYMERLLLFTDALGLTPPKIEWKIPVAKTDQDVVNSLLEGKSDFIVISPCSSVRKNNWRNWTKENYAKIAEIIYKEYHKPVILTGGKSDLEKEYGDYICNNSHVSIINLIGKLNLKQLLFLLKKATAVISPDSGPAHMANAVGTPVIGLFCTSNPDFTGPYNNRDWIVNRYPDAMKKYYGKNIDEVPWGKRVRFEDAVKMITIEDVVAKLEKLNELN